MEQDGGLKPCLSGLKLEDGVLNPHTLLMLDATRLSKLIALMAIVVCQLINEG